MSVGDQEGTTATNLTADQTSNTISLKEFYEPKFQAGDFNFTLEEGNHGMISQDVPGVQLNG